MTPGDSSSPSPKPPDPLPALSVDLAAVYLAHRGRLWAHARRTLPAGLRHEAETAVMEVFTRLHARQQREPLPEPAAGWQPYLLTAVRNACYDLIRAAPVTVPVDTTELEARHRGDVAGDPTADDALDDVERHHQRALLAPALRALPPRSREIIARWVNGETNKTIGEALGLTGQRVSQLRKQVLQQLREEVTRDDG